MTDEPANSAPTSPAPTDSATGLAATHPAADLAPTAPVRRGRSMEARASLTFKLLAALGIVIGAIVAAGPPSMAQGIVVREIQLAAVVVLAVIYLVEAFELDRRRTWAVAAAPPMLVLVIGTGLVTVLVNLSQGRFTVPIDAALASWSLLGRREAAAVPWRDWRTSAAVAATVVAVLGTTAVGPLLGPGGFLDVHEADINAGLDVACGSPAGDPPKTIDLTFHWAWTTASAIHDGFDSVVVGWTGFDANGQPLYVLGDLQPTGPGVEPGVEADDPTGLVTSAMNNAGSATWEWGIDLPSQQLASGAIHVRLVRAQPDSPPMGSGDLLIQATYVHRGAWDHQVEMDCSW